LSQSQRASSEVQRTGPMARQGRVRRARSEDRRAADPARLAKRRRHERFGRWAELAAACVLMLKGYRILARRFRSRYGEIDVIAVRGQRLAFVEVKARQALLDGEAAIGHRQIQRMTAAAESWVSHHPRYRNHRLGFDAVLVGARCWPQHRCDALHG